MPAIVHIITCFDDGNERFANHPNAWYIESTWRGKVALVNAERPEVRLASISAWKVTPRDL